MEVVELELDGPGSGELLVRVDAAGLCHSDLSVVNGDRPRPTPMVLGHEAAGEVVGVGSGVPDVVEGDHVVLVFVPRCGSCADCASGRPALCKRAAAANESGELLRGGRRWGLLGGQVVHHHLGVSAFSEYVVVDRGSVVIVPSSIPPATAALFGCALLTGTGAVLTTSGVRPGESVAIFGLGGVGMAAVLGASLVNAEPLIAIDPIVTKREIALELGATHAFAPEDAVDAIHELTDGGVDHSFEAVGSANVLRAAWDACRRGGSTVAIGLPHPSQQFQIPAVQLVGHARQLLGSYLGDAVPERDLPRLMKLWRTGKLSVEQLRSSSLDLADINQALDDLEGGAPLRQVFLPQGWAAQVALTFAGQHVELTPRADRRTGHGRAAGQT